MATSYRDYQRRTEARRLGREIPSHRDYHESDTAEDGEKELHHLAVYAHEAGTRERPMLVVQHHHAEDDSEPEEHEFSDGDAMLHHIARHAAVPGFHEE
jgi:hypothetical protein